jgi:hypothetical protein
MPKTKQQAATVGGSADHDEIVCVSPDVPRLVGAGAIRAWPEGVRKIESLASSVHNVRQPGVEARGTGNQCSVARLALKK